MQVISLISCAFWISLVQSVREVELVICARLSWVELIGTRAVRQIRA